MRKVLIVLIGILLFTVLCGCTPKKYIGYEARIDTDRNYAQSE